ncbi:MAG TPA: hypothetical protein VEI03_19855 [Stellaceae bacterium]|nr:hypothetical protein [Stellaceae bacterium]
MANTPADDAAEIASRILLETKSVPLSPVSVDCRRCISFPRVRRRPMDLGTERIERMAGHDLLDAVAGGETAGISFAARIAEWPALPMLCNARIDSEMAEGARVVPVEAHFEDPGGRSAARDGNRTGAAA